MRKNLCFTLLLSAMMALGLMLACSTGGDDDSGDDDGGDDDCDVDDPLPSDQCSGFCNQATCNIAVECGFEENINTCVEECLAECQAGCIPANAPDCFDNFTDCDTLMDCMGIEE